MSFPGLPFPASTTSAPPPPGVSPEDFQAQQKVERAARTFQDSCALKVGMAGIGGFVLGGAFGLFMSSMAYDTPMTPQGQQLGTLPIRQQLKVGLKDMGSRSLSSAKNFGKIGAIFSGVECGIEGLRAKNDFANPVAAGCVTGGILAAKAGPQATALGCAGFAAFSAAIEYYLRME